MIIKSNRDNLPQGPPILYIMRGCDRSLFLFWLLPHFLRFLRE